MDANLLRHARVFSGFKPLDRAVLWLRSISSTVGQPQLGRMICPLVLHDSDDPVVAVLNDMVEPLDVLASGAPER